MYASYVKDSMPPGRKQLPGWWFREFRLKVRSCFQSGKLGFVWYQTFRVGTFIAAGFFGLLRLIPFDFREWFKAELLVSNNLVEVRKTRARFN